MATPIPQKRTIAALDVPAADVAAEAKKRAAERAKRLALELDTLQRAIPLETGHQAELRHLLDADPDTCLPLPGIPHPRPDQETR